MEIRSLHRSRTNVPIHFKREAQVVATGPGFSFIATDKVCGVDCFEGRAQGVWGLLACFGKHPVVELLGFVDDALSAVALVGVNF